METNELRDMSDEQLELTLKETIEHLFRLRMQAQTERLDAPSELKKNRRLIARIKTMMTQRETAADNGETASKKKKKKKKKPKTKSKAR